MKVVDICVLSCHIYSKLLKIEIFEKKHVKLKSGSVFLLMCYPTHTNQTNFGVAKQRMHKKWWKGKIKTQKINKKAIFILLASKNKISQNFNQICEKFLLFWLAFDGANKMRYGTYMVIFGFFWVKRLFQIELFKNDRGSNQPPIFIIACC